MRPDQKQSYSSADLAQKFKQANIFRVDNIGNYLQSTWEKSKEYSGFPAEQKRLKNVFKGEFHWIYLLGRDIYAKTFDQLNSDETLWAMGPILYICFRLAAEEGDVGVVANQLRTDYYHMVVLLRQHFDQLGNESKRVSKRADRDLKINVRDDSRYSMSEPLHSSQYSSYSISTRPGYDPLPDYYWWQGLGDGATGHTDPLMCWVSPNYSTGNIWGYALKLQIKIDIELFRLAGQGVRAASDGITQVVIPEMQHLGQMGVNEIRNLGQQGIQGVQHGVTEIKDLVGQGIEGARDGFSEVKDLVGQGVQGAEGCCHHIYDCCTGIGSSITDCLGSSCHCVYSCTQGVCNMLGDCLSGCGNFLSGCCICNFNCNGGDGGGGSNGGGEICCCGVSCCGAIGTWLSHLCGCTSADPTNSGGDGHLLLDHSTLVQGGSHLSVQASDVVSKTWGTLFTGLYLLTFAPPAIYSNLKALKKFVFGGDREGERLSGLQDFLCAGGLGTGLFFAGLFIPWGGVHTAMTLALFGDLLGDNLSHKQRKSSHKQKYGGFPDKPSKYVPDSKKLRELYNLYEQQQPGLTGNSRLDYFDALLQKTSQLEASGRPQAEFLAAQEELETLALYLSNAHKIAHSEKRKELSKHGLGGSAVFFGIAKSYGHLFHRHYKKTPQRQAAVAAIKEALENNNLTPCLELR